MRMRSWQERKQWKLRIIRLGFHLIAGTLTVVLAHLQPFGIGKITQQSAEELIRGAAKLSGAYLDVPRMHVLATVHPDILAFLLGFFVLGRAFTSNFRTKVHDRFWISYNNDVLTPVASLQRSDTEQNNTTDFVQLPWLLGTTGPRLAAWETLKLWCANTAATPLTPQLTRRLSLAVLAGRAGSGKSRMAYEVARNLARRDVVGSSSSVASLTWTIGVYLRHAVPGLRRRDSDPWDTGLLVCKDQDNDFAQFCARLDQWHPRRPTLLVLDNPEQKSVERCWNALTSANNARPYDHPVCLLIVNQTVPTESGLEYSPPLKIWLRGKNTADPQPVLLPPEAWFTPEETRTAAFTSGYLRDKSVQEEKAIRDDLYRLTQGNPLLVQLAIEWLRDGNLIADLTADVLTLSRVNRILVALEHRGVKEEAQLASLALATLVGGASQERIETAVRCMFGNFTPLPRYSELKACFPTEPLEPGARLQLPAIRPDLIGDAFIEQVLSVIGIDRAVALAEAGFKINAAGMLRSIRHARTHSSAMTAAFAMVDPRKIEHLDPVELALAFADVAAVCQLDDRALSTASDRNGAVTNAYDFICKLNVADKLRFCNEFVQHCDVPVGQRGQRQLRPAGTMQLMTKVASNPEVQVPTDTWIAMFRLLRRQAVGEFGPVDGVLRVALAVQSEDILDDFLNASWDMGWRWHSALAPIRDALAERYEAEGNMARANRLKAMTDISDPDNARYSANASEQLAIHNPDDFALYTQAVATRRYEAVAWAQVAAGTQAARANEAANACATLAARFAVNAVIQLEVAIARRYEVIAWGQIAAGAQAVMALDAAEACAALATRFPDDLPIHIEAAGARCSEAYAWSRKPGGAGAAQTAADACAALAARFPNDPSIQREVANASSSEAFAWSRNSSGMKAAQAAANACIVLAARFPDDPIIHLFSALAWRSVAHGWSLVPAGAKARSAADACAALAHRFSDDFDIQTEAMEARRCEVAAWSRVPDGMAAAATRTAANACVALAANLPNKLNVHMVLTVARRHEAYAWGQVPAGVEAAAARTAANAAAALAALFPDDPSLQREVMQARRSEVYAWSQVPDGGQAAAARMAADICIAIATRFPSDTYIQGDAMTVRRYEASAWSQVPEGTQAVAAQAAANACAALAVHYPNHSNNQFEVIEARRYEARAWSEVPDGAQAAAAQSAAHACAAIAARFPGEPRIQGAASEARQCANNAWRRKQRK